jgi:aminopeptidase N
MIVQRRRAALSAAAFALLLAGCASAPPPDGGALEMEGQGLPDPEPIEVGRVPPPGPYAPGFDVLHYDIDITIPESGTRIGAVARLAIGIVEPRQDTLRLDLTGLRVFQVFTGTGGRGPTRSTFRQDDGKLIVPVPANVRAGDTLYVNVGYGGDPDDGLIIRDNVHGQRGAFGDNWPNRARFWFPSIDHPSDKATVVFRVRAPEGWHVIANGRRFDGDSPPPVVGRPGQGRGTSRDEFATPPQDGVWRFHMPVPIPTYLMVVGATPFSIGSVTECAHGAVTAARPDQCVAVSSWAFRPDSANAARAFRRGGDMVEFYSRIVAPFPYTNLAHVQSATRFGGMENASAIFYSERAIAEGRDIEGTVAHEVAHQWFGDAVTPADWAHVWLSEGFASYFGPLYFEHADGPARFREIMTGVRRSYLNSQVRNLAIVDTLATPGNNLLQLLNANSYQKGALVLHMLRGIMGDRNFFDGVQRYYHTHEHGTAVTADLRRALETHHGESLGWFFDQWVFRPGHPVLQSSMRWDAAARQAVVTIEQTQQADWPTFRLPLTIAFDVTAAGGATAEVRHTADVRERRSTFRFTLPAQPTAMRVDPDGWVLHQ